MASRPLATSIRVSTLGIWGQPLCHQRTATLPTSPALLFGTSMGSRLRPSSRHSIWSSRAGHSLCPSTTRSSCLGIRWRILALVVPCAKSWSASSRAGSTSSARGGSSSPLCAISSASVRTLTPRTTSSPPFSLGRSGPKIVPRAGPRFPSSCARSTRTLHLLLRLRRQSCYSSEPSRSCSRPVGPCPRFSKSGFERSNLLARTLRSGSTSTSAAPFQRWSRTCQSQTFLDCGACCVRLR
mmetsp:Transcript_25414/g.82147  ORF Transcript_25414/g.82147 Transcript_25414/m.82147 type:complete len:240 (-) Transcript_25414:98-817(-)